MSGTTKKPSAQVSAMIDQNLKRVFSKLEDEPLPGGLKEMMAKLRAQDDQTRNGE